MDERKKKRKINNNMQYTVRANVANNRMKDTESEEEIVVVGFLFRDRKDCIFIKAFQVYTSPIDAI